MTFSDGGARQVDGGVQPDGWIETLRSESKITIKNVISVKHIADIETLWAEARFYCLFPVAGSVMSPVLVRKSCERRPGCFGREGDHDHLDNAMPRTFHGCSV